MMFDFGFTKADVRRVAWTLVQAALAVVIAAEPQVVRQRFLTNDNPSSAITARLEKIVKQHGQQQPKH